MKHTEAVGNLGIIISNLYNERMQDMKRYGFIILLSFVFLPSVVYCKTMYVEDHFRAMVRRLPGEKYKILAQLPTNEKVELIRAEKGWAEISFKGGETGWVEKRYLTEEIPKLIRVSDLEARVQELTEKVEILEKENLSLKQKSAELGETAASQAEKVKFVSLENQRLREQPYRVFMFGLGGGVFLLGCIITLILQRVGRKKNKFSFLD